MGKEKLLKKSSGVIHAIFECLDCGKEFQGYKNAQGLAANHAKIYGHTVRGEVGLSFQYKGVLE